jgi:thiol-disulfide isomerase/thioredoxin
MVTVPPPPPALEIYYSPTCAPCRIELPAILDFAKSDGNRVRIVLLDQQKLAREELREASRGPIPMALVASTGDARAVLRQAGDSDAILPYARAIAPNGKMCSQWRGLLTLSRAYALVAKCAPTINAQNKH